MNDDDNCTPEQVQALRGLQAAMLECQRQGWFFVLADYCQDMCSPLDLATAVGLCLDVVDPKPC